jgi:uncharacterized protein (DUF983 family)
MQEPPIPSPYTENKKNSNLTCPFCNHQFPLTWGRYLKQGFNSHVKCPQCGEISHLQWTSAYTGYLSLVAVVTAIVVALVLGTRLFLASSSNTKYPIVDSLLLVIDSVPLLMITLLCIIPPIDKYADAHYRPLVKHKRKR